MSLPKPTNNIELYLNEAINRSGVTLPKPTNNIEAFLYKLATNGIGTGGINGGAVNFDPSQDIDFTGLLQKDGKDVLNEVVVNSISQGDIPNLTASKQGNKISLDVVFPNNQGTILNNTDWDDITNKPEVLSGNIEATTNQEIEFILNSLGETRNEKEALNKSIIKEIKEIIIMSKLITKENIEQLATGLHQKAKEYADGKFEGIDFSDLEGRVGTLEGSVGTNSSDIQNLKDAIANKNNATIVVSTESEIETANAEPKIGDLAFVINSKRAYIYKGVDTLSAVGVPTGWVVFDEITNELDLVAYLKKEEAETTYRKNDTKIAEADLDTALTQKIDGKAEATHTHEIADVNGLQDTLDGKTDNNTVKGFINNNLQTMVFTQDENNVTLTIGGADDVSQKTATLPLATNQDIQDILASLV